MSTDFHPFRFILPIFTRLEERTINMDIKGSWCTTDIVVSESSSETFTWTIKGFKDRFDDYSLKRVLSAPFHVTEAGGNKTKWILEIKNEENRYSAERGWAEIKSLKVFLHNENDKDVNTSVRISLLNSKGNECETVTQVKIIYPHKFVERELRHRSRDVFFSC